MSTLAALTGAVRETAHLLTGTAEDYDPLMKIIGDARFVLLGEASHGTHEFYQARAEITKRLIIEKGFTAVAVEADWPDAYRINRYVRGANDDAIAKLRTFGHSIGLAFQIVDDVLDVTQTSAQLGKTAGKDSAAEKATYPALFGVDESLKRADKLADTACAALNEFGSRAETLKSVARFLVERKK